MIRRRLGAVGIAMLALIPVSVSAASNPTPEQLRAALAEPVEADFQEALNGSSGLEGAFDARRYADTLASDAKSRASVLLALQEYGFDIGYGRDFSKPSFSDTMEELLMVFRDAGGAHATASTSQTSYRKSTEFQSSFDPKIAAGAYGVNESYQSYYWSVVVFTKGNDMFAIERGSGDAYPTSQAIAQAQSVYAVAPAGFDVPASGMAPSQIAVYSRLMFVGGILLAFSVAIAVAGLVFVLARRSAPAAPLEAQAKP